MIGAENWCVNVDDKIYGPYTSEQVRKYVHEGRLAAWSKIAPAGSRNWREASKEPSFASFFGAGKPGKQAAQTGRTFGKRDQDETGKGKKPEPELANFLLIFDAGEGAANRLETAIHNLGAAFRICDNVWSVTCDLTAVGVRNAIAPYLSPREPIFVVDATNGRSSWQNYAPEMHAKISGAYTSNRRRARAS
ncbi:MAG: hypothetical protein AAGD92_11925 [Pseudomonadota bacterium]